MEKEYIIMEDEGFKKGDGTKVYIEDGNFIVEVKAECGYAGSCCYCDIESSLSCDIESLIDHIEKYKEILKGETL